MNDMESIIHHTLSEFKPTGGQIEINGNKLSPEVAEEEFKLFGASECRCFNCGGFSDCFTLRLRGKFGGDDYGFMCGTCTIMHMPHWVYFNLRTLEDRKIETERQTIVRLKGLKIYNLRNHQKSIKALLILLNGLSQHRIPYELVRTLKPFLY